MLSWARSTAASYLSSPADTLGSLGQEPAAAAPAVAPAVTALAALEERGSAGSSELRALEASLRADAAAGDAPGADRGAFEVRHDRLLRLVVEDDRAVPPPGSDAHSRGAPRAKHRRHTAPRAPTTLEPDATRDERRDPPRAFAFFVFSHATPT